MRIENSNILLINNEIKGNNTVSTNKDYKIIFVEINYFQYMRFISSLGKFLNFNRDNLL